MMKAIVGMVWRTGDRAKCGPVVGNIRLVQVRVMKEWLGKWSVASRFRD